MKTKTILAVKNHVDNSGFESKLLSITTDSGLDITITLGAEEARALSAALKPSGKPVVFDGTVEGV
jgi:hypothetical protein